MTPDTSPDTIVIEPNRSWFHIPWRELFHYRDLLFLLVRRNFLAVYKQTVLGPLWFFIQPVINALVFTVIFGNVAKISTDGMPKLLFYMSGSLAWGFFGSCLGASSSALAGNAGIFQKVYFPRLIMPLSSLIGNLINFSLRLFLFLCFWGYYKLFTDAGDTIRMSWSVLAMPLLLLQSAALGLGVGLLVSSVTAKYRDLGYVAGYFTRFWMYATPVVYPLSIVPERWRWLSLLNPMTTVVEGFRLMFLGTGTLRFSFIPLVALLSLGALFGGILVFNRAERTFIDTV